MQTFTNLDANESAIFKRELEHIESKSYDVKYPTLKIANGMIIPITRQCSPADQSKTYRQFDGAGVAKIISNYADDLPSADVSGKEFTAKIKSVGASFQYNIQEVRASSKTGRRLDSARAERARRMIAQEIERIGFEGDSEYNLQGLISNPNIQEFTLPNDGTGSVTQFASKTADQILRDLNDMAAQVSTVTKGVESPDTLLLPLSVWNLLTTKRIPDTSISVLRYFLDNSPHIQNVEWLNQLTKAADNEVDDVMMMYSRDASKLAFEIPLEYEQFSPQQKNLSFTVPAHARTAGVIIYYPLSIIKAEGV